MTRFLTNTFSPAMLKPGRDASVEEISLDESKELLSRLPDAWWAWHDSDQSRWSQSVEEGISQCTAWCNGDSDYGPESSWTSAVSHELTASVLGALLGVPVAFNRMNLALDHGDTLVCVIPNFRASEAREFTREEVEGAGFRCFLVSVEDLR